MRREEPRPFEHEGDHRGVLCLHGFTGTPAEVRYLGGRLAARGFTVVAPVLAGHESTAAALNATTWQDWLGTADMALDALLRRCSRVAVVGLSLGGLLSLHLARSRGRGLAAFGALATPLWLPRWAEAAIPLVDRVARWIPRLAIIPSGASDVCDPVAREQSTAMPVYPVHALASLLAFTRIVRDEIGLVTTPAFIAHGQRDHNAPPACSAEIVRRLGSNDVKHLVLPASYHVVTIDVERERLADELAAFLAERM